MALPILSNEKPSLDRYPLWLKRAIGVQLGRPDENYYSLLSSKLLADVKRSDVWNVILDEVQNANDKYSVNTGSSLIANRRPELLAKPYSSIVIKTYRRNIVTNQTFLSLRLKDG